MVRSELAHAVLSDTRDAAPSWADKASRAQFYDRVAPARAFPRRKTFARGRGSANRDNRVAFQERKPESGTRKGKNTVMIETEPDL